MSPTSSLRRCPNDCYTVAVAKKHKPKPFRAVTAVKSMSREQIGVVPPTRRVENTKKKHAMTKPKHKPSTQELLSDEI